MRLVVYTTAVKLRARVIRFKQFPVRVRVRVGVGVRVRVRVRVRVITDGIIH